MKGIVVIGAGGQARELRWIIQAINERSPTWRFLGFVISDYKKRGPDDSEVLGDYEWLRAHRDEVQALAIGIGTPAARLRVAAELEGEFGPEFWPALVHPTAIFDRATTQLGHGCIISAGVVGTVNLILEPFALANFGCTLGHEAVLSRGVVVNPGSNISGGVVLEEGALVGTGAQLLQYRRVGRHSRVGAGAVVTTDVPADTTVVGIPAKPLPLRA